MIRAARWLPLSLAIHGAAVGGGVWLGRDFSERALFVDMRLIESDVPPVRAKSPRAGSPAPPAAPAARRPAVRSAPAAAPPVAAEPPTAAPPVTPAPSFAPTPSVTPEPSVASVPPPVDAPAADAQASPSGAQSFIAGETSAASDGGRGAASARSSVGSAQTGGEGEASATRGGTFADGPLALAIPGDGGVGVYGPYLSALRRRLQEALEYPAAARRRGLSGTVHLEVVLDATGRVSEVLLARSSSHAVLDDAALEAARRLPRVPFPPDVRPRPLRVLMPVDFQLR